MTLSSGHDPHRDAIEAAARRIYDAHQTRVPCAPIADLLGGDDLQAAYTTQEINTHRWLAEGRRLVGRKIGLTSKAVQRNAGINQPDYGMLFADMEMPCGEELPRDSLYLPKAEGEVAFMVGRPLDREDLTLGELLRGIEYAVPALEIIDTRYVGWEFGITDTIADNASSGLYVLGGQPVSICDVDLELAGMTVERNGEAVSFGAGAACFGHPLNAALWLARTMAKLGRPLGEGDLILSGALGPMVPMQPGDDIVMRIHGLGTVTTRFAADHKPHGDA